MRLLLSLLALTITGCATPMSMCLGALENGDKFVLINNGKRTECFRERVTNEKVPVDSGASF